MHEVAIVEGIIASVEKQKKEHAFYSVISIAIMCGKYNCVSEENLNFCWHVATQGTYLETAKLHVHRLPERYRCSKCNKEFSLKQKEDFICPTCLSRDVMPLLNSELYLNQLEVE
ncbi:MAG: hydrogenase maturation nickel metallochaperone HypA [Candidatus Omnitrophica bacterium]|nr:hydrogenase maturation nickel metallochaperone HypA [Candidatus Omnitrophota bacterium]